MEIHILRISHHPLLHHHVCHKLIVHHLIGSYLLLHGWVHGLHLGVLEWIYAGSWRNKCLWCRCIWICTWICSWLEWSKSKQISLTSWLFRFCYVKSEDIYLLCGTLRDPAHKIHLVTTGCRWRDFRLCAYSVTRRR